MKQIKGVKNCSKILRNNKIDKVQNVNGFTIGINYYLKLINIIEYKKELKL